MNSNNAEKQKTNPAPAEEKRSAWREFFEFIKVIVFALVIAVPIRYFIAQPFIVRGQSMEPNFEDKEYLIINELSYFFRNPKRGEVIVFRYPNNTNEFFIKRVIGLPEEKIEIKNGQIVIFDQEHKDGFVLNEPYIPEEVRTYPNYSATLSKEQYLVLGDNRLHSSDSRFWGPLDKKYITGAALFRAWPFNRFGFVSPPEY